MIYPALFLGQLTKTTKRRLRSRSLFIRHLIGSKSHVYMLYNRVVDLVCSMVLATLILVERIPYIEKVLTNLDRRFTALLPTQKKILSSPYFSSMLLQVSMFMKKQHRLICHFKLDKALLVYRSRSLYFCIIHFLCFYINASLAQLIGTNFFCVMSFGHYS